MARSKMHKKGFFISGIVDSYGWLIFILGVLIFIAIAMVTNEDITYKIKQESSSLDDNTAILSILRADTGNNQNMADLIIQGYLSRTSLSGAQTPTLLKDNLNDILNKVYGSAEPVCWALYYYEYGTKILLAEEGCGKKTDMIFDGQTTIPVIADKVTKGEKQLKIRLSIPGYKAAKQT